MTQFTSVFILDPPERLDWNTDTSVALMQESLRRGHRVGWCPLTELRLADGTPRAQATILTHLGALTDLSAGEVADLDLTEVDVVHRRKDPPVDVAYLQATLLLDRLPAHVLQINPPDALRRHCEKLIPLHFPDLTPESVVTAQANDLEAFLARCGRVVIKPLEECSGRGLFLVAEEDPNRNALFAQATGRGTRFVQAQRFLPEVAAGDKRVLLLGGEVLGVVRRVPAPGDFRANVNAGASCHPSMLSPQEIALCAQVGRWLTTEGIHLAGVDLIGEWLLEVNITSPSCLREINELEGTALEAAVLDYIEARCRR